MDVMQPAGYSWIAVDGSEGDRRATASKGTPVSDLEGSTVVITGAASGQGRAGAVLFARAGADLALCDIDLVGLDETARLARSEREVDVLAQQCDMASVGDVAKFASAVMQRYDAVDVIYNNAGVIARLSIEETSEADWDRVMGVNLKGPFFLVQHLLPALLKSGHASIVNVSSIAGVAPPRADNATYAASKGALMALTRAQARDLAPHGIRVNCLVPGAIDTAMPAGAFAKIPEEQREAARAAAVSRSLFQRFGTPEEVAGVAVFLAGPAASYITGAMIPVDGGWTAC
jgi:NAD(P)-dependent dehydrogenase (short-subunit alcohol dehydrogenase family)